MPVSVSCYKLNSDLFSAGVGLRKSYPEYVYITLVFWAVKTLLEMRLCKFIMELPSEYQLSPDSKQILSIFIVSSMLYVVYIEGQQYWLISTFSQL